jgi:hypothetical protein
VISENEPKFVQAGVEISKKQSQKRTQVWGGMAGFVGQFDPQNASKNGLFEQAG